MYLTAINLSGICGIYAWIHRPSGMCYVGSSLAMGRRIRRHRIDSANPDSTVLLHRAIRALGIENFDMELLEECAPDKLIDREKFYMALLNSDSVDGLNTYKPRANNLGGKMTEATKSRMSIAQTGRKHTNETKAQMSAYWTGKKHTAATCVKIKTLRTGTKLKPETIEKLRQINLKRWAENPWPAPSAEQRAKISKALTGVKHSPERRRKAGAARKGIKRRPESVAKTAAANTGKKRTQASRDLMRQKALAYQARKRAALMACEI